MGEYVESVESAAAHRERLLFHERVLSDLQSLSQTIVAARREVAALRVDNVTQRDISGATDELDAVVEHTAAATDCILEVCEALDRLASELDPGMSEAATQALQAATTRIYEACTFQDITGQRIAKVVGALKTIDGRLAAIMLAFGEHDPVKVEQPAGLLNGPQLAAHAMGQSDVDRLLGSF